jgi:hypothetical protein
MRKYSEKIFSRDSKVSNQSRKNIRVKILFTIFFSHVHLALKFLYPHRERL